MLEFERLLPATAPPRDSWLVKVGSVKVVTCLMTWFAYWTFPAYLSHKKTSSCTACWPAGWINWVMHHDSYKRIDQHTAAAAAAARQSERPELDHAPKLSQWVKQHISYVIIYLIFHSVHQRKRSMVHICQPSAQYQSKLIILSLMQLSN